LTASPPDDPPPKPTASQRIFTAARLKRRPNGTLGAALSGQHAADESDLAQELGRHLKRFLDRRLDPADLDLLVRLHTARSANVKRMDSLLALEQRLDEAAGRVLTTVGRSVAGPATYLHAGSFAIRIRVIDAVN
jgi:hypothetical protein